MSVPSDSHPPKSTMDEEIQKTMEEAEKAVDGVANGETPEVEIVIEDGGESAGGSEEELETLRTELATTKDRWLRAVADLENYKKRVKREIDESVQRSVKSLLNDFLPVVDNLDRALEAATRRDEQISDGIKMVRQVFLGALEKNGIAPVPGIGSRFDPAHHDALQQMKSEDLPPGHVMMVYENGFLRHGKLLRPSKVIVSDESSTGTAPAEADSEDPEAGKSAAGTDVSGGEAQGEA